MFDCLSVVFVSFSLNFSPTKISLSVSLCYLNIIDSSSAGPRSTAARSDDIRSGNYPWPLVVGNFPCKLLYQLLVRWLLQRPRVQKYRALVPSARVVNEGLRAVDSATEKGSRAHPRIRKLSAILRRDHHAESRIGASYLDCVRAARKLERVVRGLLRQFVLFRVLP